MNKTKYIWIAGIVLLAGALFYALAGSSANDFKAVNNFEGDIKIYTSSTCGCCDVYASYFQRNGNSNAEAVNLEDIDSFKDEQGVPAELRSCHVTIIGDYFVEGHMPLEAVEKLLEEKPNIAGIALPGMPEGAPGMTGNKRGDFIIYDVNNDGTYQEFMRI